MSGTREYAGFWRRAGAHVIDTLIFLPVAALLLYLVYGGAYFSAPAQPGSYRGAADFIINNVLPVIAVIVLWVRFGATPGKQLMGCRIVDEASGGLPRPGKAVIRWFGYLASALPLGLGFWWIAWDKKKQGFHDKLAGTVVVRVHGEDASQKSLEQLAREGR